MGQVEFLHALLETGRVKVGPVDGPIAGSPGGDANLLDVLREWDAANRLEFPGEAPPLLEATARRAVDRFYRACQLTVYRDVDAATVAELFAEPVQAAAAGSAPARTTARPVHASTADHYAVDLVFRFLPDLYRLAYRTSAADPLCEGLRKWAAEWPLSSVGMSSIDPAAVNPADLSTVCEDGGLLRLYADRIIARGDVARLADSRVRTAVRTAIGFYDELSPAVAKALKTYDPPPLAAAAADPSGSPGPTPTSN
jgi:hypothetical protein